MQQKIESYFSLREQKTTIRTEVIAGITTFLTMAYIIVVQPAVLSGMMFGFDTGMDFGALTTATCIAAALATLIMGLYANYPIAQAPGMGQNFFFVFSVIPAAAAAGFANAWEVALAIVFISGVIFLLLTLTGIRERLINAISKSLKNGIAVGIGLFIAFIGLQNTGLILPDESTAVTLNTDFGSPDLFIFFAGLLITCGLYARNVKGSIIWGILAASFLTIAGYYLLPYIYSEETLAGYMLFNRFEPASTVFAAPPSIEPTLFKMDFAAALTAAMIPFIVIFLIMDVFDTMGTLVGVGEQAGFMKDNKLPRAEKAMLSDAVGTVAGAAMGTSTVTSYIESTAGVEQGGRTGLTAVVVAVLFLLALFISPVVTMLATYPPITAPALVLVGAMMLRNVVKIKWSDFTESMPAFLILAGIPLTYSISDGLAIGFICYPVIKLLAGRGREVSLTMWILAAVLVSYFILINTGV